MIALPPPPTVSSLIFDPIIIMLDGALRFGDLRTDDLDCCSGGNANRLFSQINTHRHIGYWHVMSSPILTHWIKTTIMHRASSYKKERKIDGKIAVQGRGREGYLTMFHFIYDRRERKLTPLFFCQLINLSKKGLQNLKSRTLQVSNKRRDTMLKSD